LIHIIFVAIFKTRVRGFKSTKDAIAILDITVQILNNKLTCNCTLVDLSKAFDCIKCFDKSYQYKQPYLFGYNTVQCVESEVIFWRHMLPPSSRLKYKPSKKPATSR
jgi:hypothetical protein